MSSKPTLNQLTDEDLDDLDDVLNEFGATGSGSKPVAPASPLISPPPPPPTATTTTTFGRPRTNTRVDKPPVSVPSVPSKLSEEGEDDEDALTAEFAKELAKGMENLMKELADESGSIGEGADKEKTMKAWEEMLIQGMSQMANIHDEDEAGPSGEKKDDDFQAKIQETVNRLKESEANFKSTGDTNPESLKDLLSLMQDFDIGTADGDGENEEQMTEVLEGMMGTLMSKEILYEPLQELAEKYPGYLENPPSTLAPEDKTRYESQLACVRKITAIFDDPNYSESNQETTKSIVDLMSEMQSYGNPPEEVIGPLPTSMSEGCVVA